MTTILCRLPNHVGDCCMCLPALRLLEASGYTPTLAGKRWGDDLLAGMGWRFDPIEGRVTEDISRVRNLIANTHAKESLLFPNSMGSALLFRLSGIPATGLSTDGRSILLRHRIPEPDECHEVERFFYVAHEAIKSWGGTPTWDDVPKELGLRVLKRHEAAAKNLKTQYCIPKKFALLAPIARGLHKGKPKHWPYFNDLVKPLLDRGITPIIFPGHQEEEDAKKACPDAMILPSTTLGNYAALCQRAQIVIANDSGVSHVAAAVGAKQITLIGVTSPNRTRPWNPNALVLGEEGAWPTIGEVIAGMDRLLAESV